MEDPTCSTPTDPQGGDNLDQTHTKDAVTGEPLRPIDEKLTVDEGVDSKPSLDTSQTMEQSATKRLQELYTIEGAFSHVKDAVLNLTLAGAEQASAIALIEQARVKISTVIIAEEE